MLCMLALLSNRYRLHFEAETQKEHDHRKHEAKTKPLAISKIAEVTLFGYYFTIA